MVLHILRPDAEDYSELTNICFKIKMHWGYPEYLIELWKDELTITPRFIRNHDLLKVINGEGRILGFGAIAENGNGQVFEINHFWILPEYNDQIVGKILLEQLESLAPHRSTIKIIADPNSTKFYQRYGYQKVGEVKSKPDGMDLPLMKKILR